MLLDDVCYDLHVVTASDDAVVPNRSYIMFKILIKSLVKFIKSVSAIIVRNRVFIERFVIFEIYCFLKQTDWLYDFYGMLTIPL